MTDLAHQRGVQQGHQVDPQHHEDDEHEVDDRERAQRLSRSLVSQRGALGGDIPSLQAWKAATSHTRSRRSAALKKIDKTLERYHRLHARSPQFRDFWLNELVRVCMKYSAHRRGGKRLASVSQLLAATRAQLQSVEPTPEATVTPATTGSTAPPNRPPPSAPTDTLEAVWMELGPRLKQIVDATGARGKPWDEIRPVVEQAIAARGLTGDPRGILDWCSARALFVHAIGSPDVLIGTRWSLDRLASRVLYTVTGATTPYQSESLAAKIDQILPGTFPFDGAAVIAHARDKGLIEEIEGQLVTTTKPAAPGEQASVRGAAQGQQSGDQSRLAPAGDTGGWATLGMWAHHQNEAQAAGGTVEYDDAGARAGKVLQLVNGVFIDADGQLAQGPDLSHLGPAQVWATSPAAATTQRNALLEKQGWTKAELDDANAGRGVKDQQQHKSASMEVVERMRNDPRLIFVMNAAGQFFAAQAEIHVTHHSTFLAGGAVAAAGELGLSSGRPMVISNESGHYQPGPAYLWQAVRQMQLGGADMSSVRVEMFGCAPITGAEFLARFDPAEPEGDERHLSFDQNKAVAAIQAWQSKRA